MEQLFFMKVSPVVSAGISWHSCSIFISCAGSLGGLLITAWLESREGSIQQTTFSLLSRMLLSDTLKGASLAETEDCLLSLRLLRYCRRLTSDTKYLGIAILNLLAQDSTYSQAELKVNGDLLAKKGASLGIRQCQQAVFSSTMFTISHTILSSVHCCSSTMPSQQCGPKRQFLLKSLFSHTFTLPSQSMPSMSSFGRKQPIRSCSFWNPSSAEQRIYRFSGSGMSLMLLSRQGVCQMYTLAYTLLPQKDSSLTGQKQRVLMMCSSRSRHTNDSKYCSISSPF